MDFPNTLSTSPDIFLGGAGTTLFDDTYSDDSDTSYFMSDADKYRRFLRNQRNLKLNGGLHTVERYVFAPTWMENPHTKLVEQISHYTKVPVSVFTTPEFPGANIRDAISGRIELDMFTGKYEENLYFKVKLSAGELPVSAKSRTLFFGSTKEYEDHMHTKLGDNYRSMRGLTASEIDAEIMANRIEFCNNTKKTTVATPVYVNPVSNINILWNGKSYKEVLTKT
jgi:hypothetical protein